MTLKCDVKLEEKLTCGLKNNMRNLEHFFTRALESLKIGILMASFIQSRKCMSLKFAGICHDNNAKFEEELICHFKIETRNLMDFDLST